MGTVSINNVFSIKKQLNIQVGESNLTEFKLLTHYESDAGEIAVPGLEPSNSGTN